MGSAEDEATCGASCLHCSGGEIRRVTSSQRYYAQSLCLDAFPTVPTCLWVTPGTSKYPLWALEVINRRKKKLQGTLKIYTATAGTCTTASGTFSEHRAQAQLQGLETKTGTDKDRSDMNTGPASLLPVMTCKNCIGLWLLIPSALLYLLPYSCFSLLFLTTLPDTP